MKTQLLTLTPLECDKLLRHLQSPPEAMAPPRVQHRNYTIALIMLDAGLRVGEVIQLCQDQLYFPDASVRAVTINANQAKNKMERTIPITIRLRDAIEQMHRQWWCTYGPSTAQYAFYQTSPSQPLTARRVQQIIKSAGIQSLGREIHPHLLRHTFATRLMMRTSMRVVQQLLGHTSITSTQIYTHPNSNDYQKAIDSLNETE